MAVYDAEGFTSHFNQFAAKLERQRAKSKTLFFLCAAIAAALVVLLPWYAAGLAEFLNKIVADIAGEGWKEHASGSDILAVCLLMIAVSLFLVLWPIFSYRGSNKAAGLLPRKYSFKDYVYSHLLTYFGDFQFAPEGGMLARDLAKATIIPRHQLHTAEDYIKGILHDCTVKIAETEIAKVVNKQRVAVFKGLLVSIDFCDSRIKLRGTLAGDTVLIADAQKDISDIAVRYAAYRRFDLKDNRLENRFEAFTTDTGEAERLLSPALLETLLRLQETLSTPREQRQHWDDKVAYAARAIFDHVTGALRVCIERPFRKRLEAEKAYDELYGADLDLTKANPISMELQYANRHVQAEFYDDKVLITLPFRDDLFEPNSLFEPALHDEDRVLLFLLMQCVDQVTAQLKAYFESRQA